jgi:hypothetical protein
MGIYIVAAIALIGGILTYLFFRKPKNRFLEDIGNLSSESRASVLLQATIFRLTLERDSPLISEILLDPQSQSKADCIDLRDALIEIVIEMRRSKKQAENRFHQMGMKITEEWQKSQSEHVHACSVWVQTVSAINSDHRADAEKLWKYLRESVPYLNKAVMTERERHEISTKLLLGSKYMNDLPEKYVIKEAVNWPTFIEQ